MKFYGNAEQTANHIIRAFQCPELLPKALAPLFIQRNDDCPCRKWSWSNQLLVALSGTSDARGIRQWNSIGRRVNAGCKALYILAPITIKRKAEGETDDRYVTIGFKTVPVFRFEDTNGKPLELGNDENKAFLDSLPLSEVARAWGISVDCFDGENAGHFGYFRHGGTLGTQSIALGVKNLSTWAHEMIHAADHRLVDLSRQSKLDKEIVAELGGATLLQCLGMESDADLGGAFEYCNAYADAEKKQLLSVCSGLLDRVCNAVSLILETSEKTQANAAQLCEVA